MLHMTIKRLAVVCAVALLPAAALAARKTITLATGNPANVYQDASGNNRDRSVKVTRYQEWPPVDTLWTATDYAWPGGQRPPLVTEDAYATGWLGWAWAQIPGGEWDWINWTSTNYSQGMSYYMGADRSGPYHADYEVSFTMPAHFTNAKVEIQYSADDWMSAYLNGKIFVDQHSPVIAYYLDGVPPPADLCGFSCISSTTVADAAQFLVAGTNSFTARQWEPDGIGGVAFQVRISYDDTLEVLLATLRDLSAAVGALPAKDFRTPFLRSTLLLALRAESMLVEAGNYREARFLAAAVLATMNGVATAGAVDRNDWVITASGQALLYPMAAGAVGLLTSLL